MQEIKEIRLPLGSTLKIIAVDSSLRDTEQRKALGHLRTFVRAHETKIANLESGSFDDVVGFETDDPKGLEGLVENLRTAKIPAAQVFKEVAGVFNDPRGSLTPEQANDRARTFVNFLSRFAEAIPVK